MKATDRGRTRHVSVIVPVHDATHLAEQLDALAKQGYAGRWDLLIVATDHHIESRGWSSR